VGRGDRGYATAADEYAEAIFLSLSLAFSSSSCGPMFLLHPKCRPSSFGLAGMEERYRFLHSSSPMSRTPHDVEKHHHMHEIAATVARRMTFLKVREANQWGHGQSNKALPSTMREVVAPSFSPRSATRNRHSKTGRLWPGDHSGRSANVRCFRLASIALVSEKNRTVSSAAFVDIRLVLVS
jgi:hypothetical protein